jgi:hypothetical protein
MGAGRGGPPGRYPSCAPNETGIGEAHGGYPERMTSTERASSARDDGLPIDADDVVAWSGQVEDQARRVLASGGPDTDTAKAIERALEQLRADRANGESAHDSTMYLQQMLDRDELRRG